MRSRRLLLALAATAPLALVARIAVARTETVTIAAASDLKFALDEWVPAFERDSGLKLRVSYGSSGQFTTQILQGAPFHLFLSADEDLVERLVAAGRTIDRGHRYALGRIGLFVPQGSPLKADPELRDLAAALKDGRLRKFAIAQPEHAPYGQRAREALQHAGLWETIRPHLVYGENIAQAMQFTLSGAAQAGILALSLVRAPGMSERGQFALIPASWHRPLRQRLVRLKGAPPTAERVQAALLGPAGQALLARYGFEPADK